MVRTSHITINVHLKYHIVVNEKYKTSSNKKENSTKQTIYICYIGRSFLERSSSTKFLGVIIDENLTWKNHIDAISKNFSRIFLNFE